MKRVVAIEPATVEAEAPRAVLEPIEALFERLDVPRWQRLGLMRHKRWGEGKRVSEAELVRKLMDWLHGPAAGR